MTIPGMQARKDEGSLRERMEISPPDISENVVTLKALSLQNRVIGRPRSLDLMKATVR